MSIHQFERTILKRILHTYSYIPNDDVNYEQTDLINYNGYNE